MHIKKLVFMLSGIALLSGCTGGGGDWGSEWTTGEPAERPMEMSSAPAEYGEYAGGEDEGKAEELKTVAVLLPLSGVNGNIGVGIQHAIEIAFFQKQPENILVSFYDISGTEDDKRRVMDTALASNPNLVIGPLFADDAMMLKDMKPENIPAITFTSAKQALGRGVFTLALLPNQAVETVVKEINSENRKKLLVLVPDTATGHMLANNATLSANAYGVEIAGLYMYDEGDTARMKELAEEVSLYKDRTELLVEAKEILADVLISQKMTATEKESVKTQLEEMNKRDSIGGVPFDSVLFLGNAADSKTLGAYLRYYDVPTAVQFYGSALWDIDAVWKDVSLAGGEYAGLPKISDSFAGLYSEIEGAKPNRFNTVGYDAAMLAIRSLGGKKPAAAYLLDPSGYNGIDGLVRLRPNGENERALQIMQLNGVGQPAVKRRAATNFVMPIYKTDSYSLDRPGTQSLPSGDYDPMDYITLPGDVAGQYAGKAFADKPESIPAEIEYIEVQETETITDPEYKSEAPAAVDKKLIDEVQMKAN